MPRMVARWILLVVAMLAFSADAAPKKKYHFEIIAVNAKPEVKPDVAKTATARVETQLRKAMAGHAQLVADLDGAPDPKANADAYRKYLAKKGIAGSYVVTVDLTEASEKIEPISDKPGTQRLVVHVALHLLGETVPGRTMGFTGDGQATVKQEVGMKISDRDREFTWDSAAEVAVGDALKTAFVQLDKPQKKQ
jgi:hypothetical protein